MLAYLRQNGNLKVLPTDVRQLLLHGRIPPLHMCTFNALTDHGEKTWARSREIGSSEPNRAPDAHLSQVEFGQAASTLIMMLQDKTLFGDLDTGTPRSIATKLKEHLSQLTTHARLGDPLGFATLKVYHLKVMALLINTRTGFDPSVWRTELYELAKEEETEKATLAGTHPTVVIALADNLHSQRPAAFTPPAANSSSFGRAPSAATSMSRPFSPYARPAPTASSSGIAPKAAASGANAFPLPSRPPDQRNEQAFQPIPASARPLHCVLCWGVGHFHDQCPQPALATKVDGKWTIGGEQPCRAFQLNLPCNRTPCNFRHVCTLCGRYDCAAWRHDPSSH